MAVGVQVPPSAPSKKGHLRFLGALASVFRSSTGYRSQAGSVMVLTNMACIMGGVVPLLKDRPLINALSPAHLF